MLGQKAIYHKQEVTIAGYVTWGKNLAYFWIKFPDGTEEKVKAKSVKLVRKRKRPKAHAKTTS